MWKTNRKKWLVLSLIAGMVTFGTLAFRAPEKPEHPAPQNLKILPKDITHPELIAIMHGFERALNYSCGDCHARSQADPEKLDFASDANPKKETARAMMKMVQKINRRHFKIKGKFVENFTQAKYQVTCYSCHHGEEHPAIDGGFKKK